MEDHFCQTWSLLIALEFLQRKPAKALDNTGKEFVFCLSGPGLSHILQFLRKILSIDTIAEGLYYEIYHRTHRTDGQRHYGAAIDTYIHFIHGSHHCVCFEERYFSTLEKFATATAADGHESYYSHGVTYRAMGYTFLEDFLDCLDCDLLENILA